MKSVMSTSHSRGGPVHHRGGLRISFLGSVTYLERESKPEPAERPARTPRATLKAATPRQPVVARRPATARAAVSDSTPPTSTTKAQEDPKESFQKAPPPKTAPVAAPPPPRRVQRRRPLGISRPLAFPPCDPDKSTFETPPPCAPPTPLTGPTALAALAAPAPPVRPSPRPSPIVAPTSPTSPTSMSPPSPAPGSPGAASPQHSPSAWAIRTSRVVAATLDETPTSKALPRTLTSRRREARKLEYGGLDAACRRADLLAAQARDWRAARRAVGVSAPPTLPPPWASQPCEEPAMPITAAQQVERLALVDRGRAIQTPRTRHKPYRLADGTWVRPGHQKGTSRE